MRDSFPTAQTDPLARRLRSIWLALPNQILGLPRERFALVMLWAFAASFAIAGLLGVVVFGFGSDSHAYYLAWQGEMYEELPGELDAYLYSPAFAQALWPLTQLPWPAFALLFSTAAAVSLMWLLKPVQLRYRLPLLTMCIPEVLTGNIFWLLALVAVLGLTYPALWAIPALTKILPALGPVWFAARGEWRKAVTAAAVTAVIIAVSAFVAPQLWTEWIGFLMTSSGEEDLASSPIVPPLWVRVPAALCLTVYAARLGQRRWLPFAMLLAAPMMGHGAYALLAAVPRLYNPVRAPASVPQDHSVIERM